jgi:hypothetical protein
MLDVPCGDLTFMPRLLTNLSVESDRSFRYHGVDMSETIIEQQKSRFGTFATEWQFSAIDYTERNELPPNYDLIYVQEGVQNLPCKRMVGALRNFAHAKGAKYLLIENHMVDGNRQFRSNGRFLVNWMEPPFGLDDYVEIKSDNLNEHEPHSPSKHLILYDIPSYLRSVDFAKMSRECDRIV